MNKLIDFILSSIVVLSLVFSLSEVLYLPFNIYKIHIISTPISHQETIQII